ncbi:MAG: nickel-dependent lactate racemase [Ruminococcaceae bacterium]|nr:nickel-dependent lactate racemase [Oscillospiraceae bacterium]
MIVKLPYGKKHLEWNVDPCRIKAILQTKTSALETTDSEIEVVAKALANPYCSATLGELAKDKKNIVIISSDHTRPVPSHIIMPLLLAEINKANPTAEVTILVATGFHRRSSDSELRAKYGDEIVERVNIHIHDSQNDEMADFGLLPSGGKLLVNRIAADADLLIAEGFIEPHLFAGFSGGRKSVLPGIVSYKTVLANHCSKFIASPNARAGILDGNLMHQDMLFAAKNTRLAFIVNVVLDANKRLVKAFAGDPEIAHNAGCSFVRDIARVDSEPADIVVATNGGYPLDQNVYQAIKGMTAAEATVNDGGVIIMVSECIDGHGAHEFFNMLDRAAEPKELLLDILSRDMHETVPEQWQAQILARVLAKATVIMVTKAPRTMIESMHMRWADSIEDALSMAEKIIDRDDYQITVVPDGVSVIVEE